MRSLIKIEKKKKNSRCEPKIKIFFSLPNDHSNKTGHYSLETLTVRERG